MIKNIIDNLSLKGKLFYYGSTAILNYNNKPIKIYNLLTDINLAEIGLTVPNLIFSNYYTFDCYVKLTDNIIVTFLIFESDNIKDNIDFLKEIYNKTNNPLILYCYSPYEKIYYTLDNNIHNLLRNNIYNIKIKESISINEILDLALTTGSTSLEIKINDKKLSKYIYNHNQIEKNENQYNYLDILEKVVTSKNPYNALILLEKFNILDILFPFLKALKGIQQDRTLHPEGDVYQHTLHCFKFIKNPSLKLFYGLLLHDYGKSLSMKDNFKFHSTSGAKKVFEILKPYRYNNSFIKDIEFLVEYHMINSYFYRLTEKEKKEIFKNDLGNDLLKLFKADTLGSIGKLDIYYDIISNLKKTVKIKSS